MDNVKVGSYIKITDDTRDHNKVGSVVDINKNVIYIDLNCGRRTVIANLDFCYEIIRRFANRKTLRDFVSLNQIKTTLVSRSLGYSRNWLTQAMNRTDRGDLTDQELQAIMKQLHVDWTQKEFVHVKATKTHSAYRTRPCVYEHAKHKELLQRAFWDGRFVNGR